MAAAPDTRQRRGQARDQPPRRRRSPSVGANTGGVASATRTSGCSPSTTRVAIARNVSSRSIQSRHRSSGGTRPETISGAHPPGDAVDPIDAGRGPLAPPRPEQDDGRRQAGDQGRAPPCCRAGTSDRACRGRCSRRRAAACRARAGSRARARPTGPRGTTCRTRARGGRAESSRCRGRARTRAAARAGSGCDGLGRCYRLRLRIAARLGRHDLQRRDRGDFGSRGAGRGWRRWRVRQGGFLGARRSECTP